MNLAQNIFLILVALVFSFFFSGMEIAFVSINRLRVEVDKKHGIFSSKIVSIFIKNPGKYIATMLVGNNIALVIYGLAMAILLEPVIMKFISTHHFWVLIIKTIISALLIIITAEFLPKTLFRINPNVALNALCLPVLFFYILFFPITFFTIFISDSILKKILRVNIAEQRDKKYVFGKVDLDDFISHGQKISADYKEIEQEIKIIQNTLDFSKVKLRECIVPRNEIVACEITDTIDQLREKFVESGYSKILIYKESIDNIIGYVNSYDLFKLPESISSICTNMPIVPESMPANKLFDLLMERNQSIALVVDEYGGTAGIATIEDILEEIFGEIEDEHDTSDLIEKQTGINEYLFSGRLEIDYLNEKYKLCMPTSDDYETLAGFILFNHQTIPEENDEIIIEDFKFRIIKVDKPRIDLVKIEIIND